MFAIATVPLIKIISKADVKQFWHTDNVAAGGILSDVRKWLDDLAKIGPDYGYFHNTTKNQLPVKDHLVREATELLKDRSICVFMEGTYYLQTSHWQDQLYVIFCPKQT